LSTYGVGSQQHGAGSPQYGAGGPQYGEVPPAEVARPTAFRLAMGGSYLVILLITVSHVLALATGRSLIKDELSAAVGFDLGDVGDLVDEPYGLLQNRAVASLGVVVIALLFAFLARRGSLGARIALALFLLADAALMIVAVGDVFPAASKAAGWLAIGATAVTVVMLFLPPVNRYAKAAKAARRARRA
jgi:hypothetical protein